MTGINTPRNPLFSQSLWIIGILGIIIGGLIYAGMAVGVSLEALEQGIGKLGGVILLMFSPTLDGDWMKYIHAMGQTVAMAFLGTLTAAVLALPFSVLAARNLMPSWIIHWVSFRFFDTVRSVDMLIWALVFMSAVGPGPFAGVLAITVVEFGILSKLFAEAIETVDHRPMEGLIATGANPAQVIFFGVFPQVLPVLVSNTLYQMESNTRSASILGVVGAGGIGFMLAEQIRLNAWPNVLGMVILILIVVTIMDTLSGWIQRQVRGKVH